MRKIFSNISEKVKESRALKATLIVALTLVILLVIFLITVFAISLSVKSSASEKIIDIDKATELDDVDFILVLGAGLRSDGSPSDMLADRLLVGISLLENGVSDKLLMSGDNSGEHYNEVAAMQTFALEHGVSPDKIILDGEGYSTYESVFNAVKKYGAKKIVIVTQEYHLYRALYIAEDFGIDAYGVHADLRSYRKQVYRNVREQFARFKDFILTATKNKD